MSEPIQITWPLLKQLLDSGAQPNKPEAYRKRLAALLKTRAAEEVMRLHFELHALRVQARTRPLWCAASLLLGQPLEDDQFTLFRGWLIAHGEAVWTQVLGNPDALAAVAAGTDRSGQRTAALPALQATPGKVYQQLVEDDDALDERLQELHQRWCDSLPDGGDDTHIGWAYWALPEAGELARDFPRLWTRHGEEWPAAPVSPFVEFVRSAEVPGLGTVRVGDTLIARDDGDPFTIEGMSDLLADGQMDTEAAGPARSMLIARVRDADGGVRCNQMLGRRYHRWPHEAVEGALPGDAGEPDDAAAEADADDTDMDAWEARDDALQARVAAQIEGDVRVIYAAADEDDDGLPVDNLDAVACKGQVRFIETDPQDGERFESEVLENPTWMDLAVLANRMMCQLRYAHHVYLEGIEIVRRPKGKPKVAEFVLGS